MHDQDASTHLESRTDSEIGLDDVIHFLRRQGPLIVIIGLLAAVTAGMLTRMQPRRYEASATLVVFPPQVTSELTPATLTVLGFQKLLESDAVVHETRRRAAADGQLSEGASLAVPGDLASRIFVSRRAEDKALAPMIQLFGRAKSPEVASAITNAWAETFLAQIRALVSGSTAATVDFVDRQYVEQGDLLSGSEDQLLETRVARGRSYETLAARWVRTIAEREAKSAEAAAAYRSESRRLVEVSRGEKNLETRQEQLDAMRQALVELQVEQSSVQSKLVRVEATVASLDAQVSKTPRVITLNKAITDDALWQQIKREDGTADWSSLGNQTLVSEDVNPVYTDLVERLGVAEANRAALAPRAEQLDQQIATLRTRMDAEEAALRADVAALAMLQQTRDAGLERLTVEHAAELTTANLTRDRLLREHQDETERAVKSLQRDVEQRLELFSKMTASYNQAVIAKAQTDLEEVRLGARAVPPQRALPRRLLIKLVLGGLVGMLFGTVLGLVRHRRRVAQRAD